MSQNDDLAYGRYYESERGSGDGSRGLSDTFKKFKDTYKSHSKPSGQGYNQGGAPGVSGTLKIVLQTLSNEFSHRNRPTRTRVKPHTDTATASKASKASKLKSNITRVRTRSTKDAPRKKTKLVASWARSKVP
jgi:phospholipase D1/2